MDQGTYNSIEHVCCLMDGDRTYAIIKNNDYSKINEYAYYSGALSLERLMAMTFKKLKIRYLSINLVGRRNCLKRPDAIKNVVNLVPKFFSKKWLNYFIENKIRVKFLGDIDLFTSLSENPDLIKSEIKKVEDATSNFSDYYLIAMAAYEPAYEYMKLFGTQKFNKLEEMKKAYYGFDIPDVNLIIRSWRPKVTGCLPIMISDYSDIYFFTSPFQYFKLGHYKSILEDYSKRTESSSVKYGEEDIKNIKNYAKEIGNGNVFILGEKKGNVWLPFK